jgi:DNA-binding NarL/FixJ family response regulator
MSSEDLGTAMPRRAPLHPRHPDGPPGRLPSREGMPAPQQRHPLPRPRADPPLTCLVRVLLCDDQEVFRLGLRVILEAQPDIAVVAEAAHLPEALVTAESVPAQVVVVRQRLVGASSLAQLRDLSRGGAAVLLLAEPQTDGEPELADVLQAGVRGYLPRRTAAHRLVEAVRALARHEAALDFAATDELVRYLTRSHGTATVTTAGGRPLNRLTERQREVAELVAQGLSNEEIARRLFLSLATVKSHLTASMRRLDVRTRTQLAILVNRGDTAA